MPAEKALALVVRGTDWSETSRIATLFTREFGKVRALAKGGRRLRSNFEVAFDLLSVCDVVFLRKAHGGLDLLTEARLVERFPALRKDLAALNAGYYVAELLSDGTQDYDPHPELFNTALRVLRELGKNPTPQPPSPRGEGEKDSGSLSPPLPAPPAEVAGASETGGPNREGAGGWGPVLDSVTTFELVWLKELGYSPRLDVCASCGSEPLPRGTVRATFSPSAGGVLCPACGPAAADRRSLSAAGLATLRDLTAAAEAGCGAPGLGPGVRGELRQLLGHLVSTVLGRRPRLLGYVEGRDRGQGESALWRAAPHTRSARPGPD